ncbi:MAG: adenylate/guanylate cyclase domain-containing protein [Chloroflexota bacterium]
MESEAGLTRGFLFADLRGYSRFSEAHGDAAAARLLRRYRDLVRGVIATSGGAEIRTEGDSFYVVFRSASQAVRAGLDIVASATAETLAHPEAPISVGVGIHAGEAIESDEGPIGSAVNIAARICAAAKPGEVLVSDTVRGLTRTTLDAQFASRGRPRLKGIDDPIEVFAVAAGRSGGPARARRVGPGPRTTSLAGAGVALLFGAGAIIVGVGLGADRGGSTPAPGASANPRSSDSVSASTATAAPLRLGELAAGEYVSTRFKPRLHLSLSGEWRLVDEIEGRIILSPTAFPEGGRMVESGDVYVAPGQVVIGPINAGWTNCTGDPTAIGPTAQDMLDWLGMNPNVTIGQIEPISLRDQTALRVRVQVTDACLANNPDGVALVRFVSRDRPDFYGGGRDADGILIANPGTALDLYLIDLRPQALSVIALPPTGAKDAYAFRPMATTLVRALSIE